MKKIFRSGILLVLSALFVTPAKASSKSQINLLTLKELGQLDHKGRVQYLMTYRKMLKQLEVLQKDFGIQVSLNSHNNKNYAWWLLGQKASAQSEARHFRGLEDFDTCICAGRVQIYKNINKNDPSLGAGKCQCKRCEDSDRFAQRSVRCNGLTTGSTTCVGPRPKDRARYTRMCLEEATDDREDPPSRLLDNFKSQYGRDGSDMDRAEIEAWADKLAPHINDPVAASHLIKIAADHGTEVLPSQLKEDFEELGTTKPIQNYIDQLNVHCNKKLDQKVKRSIQEEKQKGSQLATKRWRRWQQVDTPRVENVLQVEECRRLEARLNTLQTEFDDIYPSPSSNKESRVIKEYPVTCRNSSGPGKNVLATGALACASCVADAVGTHHDDSAVRTKYLMDNISSRWLAFLGTMNQVCHTKPRLTVRRALQLIKAFGHCSDEDYNWQSVQRSMSKNEFKRELKKLRSWQKGRNLEDLGVAANEQQNGKASSFEKLFGIPPDTAAVLMCPAMDMENPHDPYQGEFFLTVHEALQGPSGPDTENLDSFITSLPETKQQQQAVKNLGEDKIKKLSQKGQRHYRNTELAQCVDSIANNETALSRAPENRGVCSEMSKFSFEEPFSRAFNTMAKKRIPVIAVPRSDREKCYVSQSAYVFKNEKGKVYDRIGFSGPWGVNEEVATREGQQVPMDLLTFHSEKLCQAESKDTPGRNTIDN